MPRIAYSTSFRTLCLDLVCLLGLTVSSLVFSAEINCSRPGAGIDTVPGSQLPSSWSTFHVAYARYGACDDGANGETWAQIEMGLMITDWSHFRALANLAQREPRFRAFLLHHVDEDEAFEVSPTTWSSFQANLHHACPADTSSKRLCQDLNAAAMKP